MTARVCSRPGCGRSLAHLRADARYCSSTCRREAARQRKRVSPAEGRRVFDWSDLAARGRVAVRRVRSRSAVRGVAA